MRGILIHNILILLSVAACSPEPWEPHTAYPPMVLADGDLRGGIVFYSDSQEDHLVHFRVLTNILGFKPVTVFHAGDLVHHGDEPELWVIFDLMTEYMRSHADFYPVMGNHDNFLAIPLWQERWELPGNEHYYTVDREGIHFVLLNTNLSIEEDSVQKNWLLADLAANSSGAGLPVILIFHRPVKTTGYHSADLYPARDDLQAIISDPDNGIIATVSGHDHNYERLVDADGIVYLVIGGAGGELRPQEVLDNPESKVFLMVHNHLVLVREGDTLQFTAFDMDRRIIDQFDVPVP
jgi:predicted phosphodiesterase